MTIPEYPITREEAYLDAIARGGGGGGGVTVNPLSVTENGTYTAPSGTAYSPVTVNVPAPAPTLISKAITANGTYAAADDGADGYSSVTVNVQGGGTEALNLLITRRITAIHSDVDKVGGQAFAFCSALKTAVFPHAAEVQGGAFNTCSGLTAVDAAATAIVSNAFSGSSSMNTLVLRADRVCSVGNINAFNNTPFASGKAGGTLYVPSALIASYQAATNWSTILGYPNNRIEAIEGSIYETQYVDGTPIA